MLSQRKPIKDQQRIVGLPARLMGLEGFRIQRNDMLRQRVEMTVAVRLGR